MIFFYNESYRCLKRKENKKISSDSTTYYLVAKLSCYNNYIGSVTGMFDSACMSMSDESRLWPVQLWGVFTDLWRRCEAVVPRLQQPRAGQRRPLLYRPTRQVPHLQQQGLSCRHCRLQVPAHLENY